MQLRRSILTERCLLLLAGVLGVLLAGCGGVSRSVSSGPVRLRPARVVRSPGAPGARIRITVPAAGSLVSGSFTARVVVARFRLVRSRPGATPRRGFGHLHFILDGGRFDQPRYSGVNGRLALRLGVNGFYSPSYGAAITYRDIPAGPHVLRVQLVNADESPTGVEASVRFNVR